MKVSLNAQSSNWSVFDYFTVSIFNLHFDSTAIAHELHVKNSGIPFIINIKKSKKIHCRSAHLVESTVDCQWTLDAEWAWNFSECQLINLELTCKKPTFSYHSKWPIVQIMKWFFQQLLCIFESQYRNSIRRPMCGVFVHLSSQISRLFFD